MKLEINLTDEQAAPILAALELLAHPQMMLTPEPSTPALPEPPEGFHPAKGGPIKGFDSGMRDDALFWNKEIESWCRATRGKGSLPYALRIGSDIARLNGLGLNLEVGKTYATNAGEIVNLDFTSDLEPGDAWGDSSKPNLWNSIGQALIDGAAQPLDHPDSIREEIPAELLPLPTPPSGFKELRWGGLSRKARGAYFFFYDRGDWVFTLDSSPVDDDGPYLEAIPADKPERKAREWDVCVSDHTGELIPFRTGRETVRVREILPGEPTSEQVQTLVDEASAICDRLESQGWAPIPLRKALAPFRKP
jgi:hypothetical protein